MSLLGIDFFPISSFKPLSSKTSYPYYCVVGEYLLVLDWVNTSWIPGWPVYTPTDWSTGKFLSRDWYWNPRLSPSLSLSCCSTRAPTCLSCTCTQTLEESVQVKLDYGGNCNALAEVCALWMLRVCNKTQKDGVKYGLCVAEQQQQDWHNSDIPDVSHKDAGFQINNLGVLHLGRND